MKVLIACEESQIVCKAFRERGHEAYSNDIIECSGGHPEWHLHMDCVDAIALGWWDLMIAHPPCTYLSYAGNDYLNIEKYGAKAIERHQLREEALNFFLALYNTNIPRICVENPRGYPMKFIKQSQMIHPYYFGDADKKLTCLWLKNLPLLTWSKEDTLFYDRTSSDEPQPIYIDKIKGTRRNRTDAIAGTGKDAKRLRSLFYPGIARAMADQWG